VLEFAGDAGGIPAAEVARRWGELARAHGVVP